MTSLTTKTEAIHKQDGLTIIHRRTVTVPTTENSPAIGEFTVAQDPNPNDPSMAASFPRRFISYLSGYRSWLSGVFRRPDKEKWTVKTSTSYENDDGDTVEDSLSLNFESKQLAEQYVEMWKQEMTSSGSKARCEIIVCKVDPSQNKQQI